MVIATIGVRMKLNHLVEPRKTAKRMESIVEAVQVLKEKVYNLTNIYITQLKSGKILMQYLYLFHSIETRCEKKYMARITDGNDLVPGGMNTPGGHYECASKCLSTVGCNSWSFTSFNNSCFLKSDEIDWKYRVRWTNDWKTIGMETKKWPFDWVSGSKACGSFCKYP